MCDTQSTCTHNKSDVQNRKAVTYYFSPKYLSHFAIEGAEIQYIGSTLGLRHLTMA